MATNVANSSVQLEMFYHDRQPLSTLSSASHDPVGSHGNQFCEMFAHEKKIVKQKELLGKVSK